MWEGVVSDPYISCPERPPPLPVTHRTALKSRSDPHTHLSCPFTANWKCCLLLPSSKPAACSGNQTSPWRQPSHTETDEADQELDYGCENTKWGLNPLYVSTSVGNVLCLILIWWLEGRKCPSAVTGRLIRAGINVITKCDTLKGFVDLLRTTLHYADLMGLF